MDGDGDVVKCDVAKYIDAGVLKLQQGVKVNEVRAFLIKFSINCNKKCVLEQTTMVMNPSLTLTMYLYLSNTHKVIKTQLFVVLAFKKIIS